MTTRLTKEVRREIETPRHGPLVVSLAPEGIRFREKGRRKSYLLGHGFAYQMAVKMQINAESAERRARKGKGR